MKKMFVSIGISGSGKGYYWKNKFLLDFPEVAEFLNKNGLTLSDITVEPDSIRREVCGDVSSHDKETIVWYLVKERLTTILREKRYVIFDATNVEGKGRRFLKGYVGVHKTAIIFEPNIELSTERILNDINNGVDRSNIPLEFLEKQFENFKRSVVKNEKWDGTWNKVVKKKIFDSMRDFFNDIVFAI